MKVNIFQEKKSKENHIDLYIAEENEEIKVTREFLDSFQIPIWGKQPEEEKKRRILPGEILYLEIVDRRCYLYLSDSVWKTDATIQSFLQQYSRQGFIRVSKSMAVNVHFIKELKAEMNMRIKIILDNGEAVVLNRNYRKEFLTCVKKIRMEAES